MKPYPLPLPLPRPRSRPLPHPRSIHLQNRHPAFPVNLRHLRPITLLLLDQLWPDANIDLSICLTDADEITQLNETFVRHKGATDVITFDYSERPAAHARPRALHGEIFVCLDEAFRQARRFRTTWQSELVRYLVHGVLHLSGFDDQAPAPRRAMRRAEDLWVRRLSKEFPFKRLGHARKG